MENLLFRKIHGGSLNSNKVLHYDKLANIFDIDEANVNFHSILFDRSRNHWQLQHIVIAKNVENNND